MENCIFDMIVAGEIPSKKVLENDRFMAFHDINPIAKVHVLVIPKTHVQSIAHISEENEGAVEGMLSFIRDVAKELGLDKEGYRVIFNTGEKAGQTVPHIHAHIIGGEELSWPGM